jgi:hypothetical protein
MPEEDCLRNGMQAWLMKNVPRTLMSCIRSKRFGSICSVEVRLMALALLMSISIPPNASAVFFTASFICSSFLMSACKAITFPAPALSISSAAE